MPRAPRVVATGVLLALALPALTSCRSSPDVAAYVGDAQVTVAELERAVDERMRDEDIAQFAEADRAGYTRQVLGFLVEQELLAAVAERNDVTVGDAAVRSRIDELIGEQDPDDVYAQLAQQGVSRADAAENIRQQLVLEELAESGAPDEEELRQRYDEVRDDLTGLEFGVITAPDEAQAEAVLAELTADPAAYPAVAARYAGSSTLPELVRGDPEEIVPVLAEQLEAAPAGSGFVQPLEAAGGVVVGFTAGEVTPTFDDARPELEAQAEAEAQEAAAARVTEVRDDLDVTVNPRYGVLDEDGRLVRGEGGVVQILDGPDDASGSGPGD
ncbi:peptidyl-prolyl cis-trans isomerase SurA [Blastococcus aurantiacus]|uniref:Peptidyl-prolyl cis-trans isomerase SurA n=1 Tax=Blastococcus aurantiacus TaxID=1550231 RepID=A0A1G7JPE7_9ACTN|nr:peptidylprolyl isomerase [Blastococcus aurantiacus]SDF26822.1 peptidyl-prolyl cis-trans isomerase SurA [Blastococcus aurantiacus]